jgi:hypothetical protein
MIVGRKRDLRHINVSHLHASFTSIFSTSPPRNSTCSSTFFNSGSYLDFSIPTGMQNLSTAFATFAHKNVGDNTPPPLMGTSSLSTPIPNVYLSPLLLYSLGATRIGSCDVDKTYRAGEPPMSVSKFNCGDAAYCTPVANPGSGATEPWGCCA